MSGDMVPASALHSPIRAREGYGAIMSLIGKHLERLDMRRIGRLPSVASTTNSPFFSIFYDS